MGDTSKFLDSDLRASLNSMLGGEFDDAIARYSKRYKTEQDPSKKRYVLIQLAECYAKANKSNFTDFLNSEVRPNFKKTDKLYATTLELENIFLTQSGKYDRAITNFNSLLSGFASDTAIVKHALYNLWSLYFLRLNDTLKAGQYFTELKTRFPKDNLTRHAVLLAKSAEVGSDLVPEGSQKSEQPEKTDTLAGNGSLGNYPNPFNPTTIINYQLSKSGHVTLKVYDILGREVATLVNENQNPGIHSTTFDASKLASGVYFYRLTAPGINQVKKMLLTK
jgi:tetratricopeptide (TPR) repeat protein